MSYFVLFQPFVDTDHVLHKYFLPREYSVILPGIAAVILLLCIGKYNGCTHSSIDIYTVSTTSLQVLCTGQLICNLLIDVISLFDAATKKLGQSFLPLCYNIIIFLSNYFFLIIWKLRTLTVAVLPQLLSSLYLLTSEETDLDCRQSRWSFSVFGTENPTSVFPENKLMPGLI